MYTRYQTIMKRTDDSELVVDTADTYEKAAEFRRQRIKEFKERNHGRPPSDFGQWYVIKEM